MSHNNSPLTEIVAELERYEAIDRSTVFRWMKTDDIEAMGALMSLIGDGTHFDRVEPPLSLDDYYEFAATYYERCLAENPDGEWSDSRTTSGWDFAKWFLQLWDDQSVPRTLVSDLKLRLANVCKKGGAHICKALVTAVLEHLFHRPDVRDYFRDWANDPELRSSYEEANVLADLKARRK